MKQEQPILLLATSQDWGGVQVFLFDLAKEMKRRGSPVIVAAGTSSHVARPNRPTSDDLGAKCRDAGIEFIELQRMIRDINPVANFLALLELIKLFRRLKPRAVHLNSSMMGAVGSLAATIAGVPQRVYCIGGWVFNEQLPSWKKSLYILIERVSALWKDVIIVVHPGDEELARRYKIKPRKALLTVPNGIDSAFSANLLSKEEAREKLGVDHDALIVGTVANAYPPKNLFWYLEVCKKIHEKDSRIHFVLIGEGPQFEELKAKRDALNAESYVMLAGKRMDAPTLYRAFDLFVLPSSKEGMSLTLLEAMAAGLPCVASDVGANKWMLGDEAGIIVNVNDADALAREISRLANDESLRQQLGVEAKTEVSERFPLEKTLERHIKTVAW